MKKTLFTLILLLAGANLAAAQEGNPGGKYFWIDLRAGQHLGLTEWTEASYANRGLPSPAVTELRATMNVHLMRSQHLGAFFDMGLGITPAPKMGSSDIGDLPAPYAGTQYWVREVLSERGSDKAGAHFKFTTGLFGDFELARRTRIMPYAGIGGMTINPRRYDVVLKEEGTNMLYNTTYSWAHHQGDKNTYMLGYLSARLDFSHRVSPRSRLLVGVEYTWFFTKVNFYADYTNAFNANIQRRVKAAGNNMNMLGVTLGISFR